MNQQDKDLLLKDLCARLRCGVKIKIGEHSDYTLYSINPNDSNPITVSLIENEIEYHIDVSIEHIKPYLRPMSSMTDEERKELKKFGYVQWYSVKVEIDVLDWLNAHHFDYRGLIEKGLALEVTKENNPYERF